MRARRGGRAIVATSALAVTCLAVLQGAAGADRSRADPPARSIGSIALQPDGKVLAAGGGRSPFVVRYTRRGRLDRRFGTKGRADLPDALSQGTIGAIALQGDGRIVISSRDAGDSHLFRLTAEGEPDGSFGTGGAVQTSDAAFIADAGQGGLVVAPGDELLVSEFSRDPGDHTIAAARYGSDGAPDPGFAGDGRAEIDVEPALASAAGPGLEATRSDGVALAPSGAVTVVGDALFPGPSSYTVAVRFSTAGAPVSSYGDDGVAVALTRITDVDDAASVGGRVAVVGRVVDINAEHGCCRESLTAFGSTGGPDDRFDAGGLGRAQSGGIDATGAGGLLFAGTETAPYGRSGTERMRVSSFDASGDLKPRFSVDGTTAFRIAGLASHAEAVAADGSGGAFVGGGVVNPRCRSARAGGARGKCSAAAIVHLDGRGRLDPSFGRDGVVTSPRLRR